MRQSFDRARKTANYVAAVCPTYPRWTRSSWAFGSSAVEPPTPGETRVTPAPLSLESTAFAPSTFSREVREGSSSAGLASWFPAWRSAAR